MKEIKVQLRHAKIDAPLECTMKLNDEFFFIENHNFCPIQIHETMFIPVWNMYFGMMQKFCFEHRQEWWDFMEKNNFDPCNNKIYDLIKANNSRQREKQRNKQQKQSAMREIIKQGKIEKYIHTCTKCGCVFTYEPSDFVGFRVVNCPCCKANQSTAKDTLYEKSGEQKPPRHPSSENVSQIASMQQQIDTFKAALLHASERILHGNKCNMVVIDPLDDCDKHHISVIFKFIDEHLNDKQENGK